MANLPVEYDPCMSQPEMVLIGLRAAGVQHGAEDVQLRIRGVPVEDGTIYFCPTRDYEITSGKAVGDGTEISMGSRCVFEWPVGAPRAGVHDALVRVVRNNGSLHLRVERWEEDGRPVTDLAPVKNLV